MNNPNASIPLGRSNQGQVGMLGQQMSVGNSVPTFGQVQAPPTIPPISAQPRLKNFQSLSNGQSPAQSYQNPSQIFGRFIDDPSQIDPREIPFDGTIAYYPTNDLSKIFAKAWDDMSNLMTVVYVPQNQLHAESDKNSPQEFMDEIVQGFNARLQKIESMISELMTTGSQFKEDNSRQTNRGKGGNQSESK